MNEKQRTILIGVGIAVVVMLAFPPYAIINIGLSGTTYVYEAGYAFLLNLPRRATIDVTTLLIQWVATAIVGGIAFILAKR